MSDPDLQSEFSDLFEVDEQDGPDPALIAARRRLVRRALITVTVVMTVALASIVGYVFWALNAPLPSPVANTRSLEAPTTQAATFALPAEGATAVAVTGAPDYLGADGVRLTAGDDGARSIASISKVITALVGSTMVVPVRPSRAR